MTDDDMLDEPTPAATPLAQSTREVLRNALAWLRERPGVPALAVLPDAPRLFPHETTPLADAVMDSHDEDLHYATQAEFALEPLNLRHPLLALDRVDDGDAMLVTRLAERWDRGLVTVLATPLSRDAFAGAYLVGEDGARLRARLDAGGSDATLGTLGPDGGGSL